MRYAFIVAALLVLAACQTPYRVVGEVDAGAEFRIEQKSDNHRIYGPLRIEEDASVAFDGQYVLVEYISGKRWAYDIKKKDRIDPDEAAKHLYPTPAAAPVP